MTWRQAGFYWLCFCALSAYYFASLRRPEGQAAAHLTRAAFITLADGDVLKLELRRGPQVIRCQRSDDRWRVLEPASVNVPSDLIAALLANLTQLPDVEVVAESGKNLAEFGLDPPVSQLTLTPRSGRPVGVRLGGRNPSGTAVYAQRDDSERVFLIGLNVRYYEDLLFAAVVPDKS